MGERTSYTHGTFSWADLATPDQEGAKGFYSELFGWTATDNPMGEGAVYSMMSIDGKDVAAISPQPQQQREAGAPPAWNNYVTVTSADESLKRAKDLGATVHADAFDVFDIGRMGVIQDPQGAFFLVWEPKQHIGASLVNAPGALSWNELHTPDLDAAEKFYGELFGWQIDPFEQSPEPYRIIKTADGQGNGGMSSALQPGAPPHWLTYFGADDVSASLDKAEQLGGNKLTGSMSIGPGTIGVAQDPQGAVFALYGGHFEP